MIDSEPHYFSQNGEDFLLWTFFQSKQAGFYVDVGAFDGIHLSNTLLFEQQGWEGICIEPHPQYFDLCRRSRPHATCLNLACVSDDSQAVVEFYTEDLGLLSGILAGRDEDVRRRYTRRGLEFKGFSKTLVPASTLNNVLSTYASDRLKIDFISIDVEGTELEVLQGLDLSRFRPRIFGDRSQHG
jgi:FkbM family methyltransferase